MASPNKLQLSTTAWVLIVANLLPVFGVFYWDWSVFNLLLVFWAENLIIGAFQILKMLMAGASGAGGRGLSHALFQVAFFAIHYGMFTLIHGAALRAIFSRRREAVAAPVHSGKPGPSADRRLVVGVSCTGSKSRLFIRFTLRFV